MSRSKLHQVCLDLLEVVGLTPEKSEAAFSMLDRVLGNLRRDRLAASRRDGAMAEAPIPMLLYCPECGDRHIDEGVFATKPHHTHACQHCGHVWRPCILTTVGVRFLPGFKNDEGGQ